VFPSPKNSKEHVGDIKHSFCRAVKIAEIPHITLHQLRHTFCTRLSEADVPLPVIQELAGHASIVMTRRYMHPANELKRKAVELILAPGKVAEPATKAATTPSNLKLVGRQAGRNLLYSKGLGLGHNTGKQCCPLPRRGSSGYTMACNAL
jgi:hypothetical protein